MVATGRVQSFRTGSYTLVKTRAAELRVYWAGDMLPPSVFVGKQVSFFGRFQTLNGGLIFMVKDALPMVGSYLEIVKPALAHLYAHAEDPRDWAEQESLDRLKIEGV